MSESFNYIAYGNRHLVADPSGELSMPKGRMFEYTPPEVAKGLEELDHEALKFVEGLPTFLCSEVESDRRKTTMIVKYGRIKKMRVEKREVLAQFETVLDFGEVTFPSLESARNIFGADGFQLYRTHWAVRSGAVEKILEDLIILSPRDPKDIAVLGAKERSRGGTEQPPLRKKKILGVADSVESFLEHLQSVPNKESEVSFFRGHEDDTYELTPSLLRRWPDGRWQFLPIEEQLCQELLIAHYDEFQSDQYCFDRLVRMQHYGLPTRLLDISSNPLVALFFACYGKKDTVGEVIALRVRSESIKYYNSDKVSCISNLSNLTFSQKNDIDLLLNTSDFNKTDVAKKLLHHIKAEKGFFEGRIRPDDLGSIVCVKAKRTNNRIRSQAGAFLLFGQDAELPEVGQDGIDVARITVRNKQHILRQLDAMNINAMTVYPSIDQTAQHLRDFYQQPAKIDPFS